MSSKLRNFEPVYAERFGLAFSTGHRFESAQHAAARRRAQQALSRAHQLRIRQPYRRALPKPRLRDKECLPQRTRGLDSGMVAAGMGVCFIAEFSASQPGVCHRLVVDPEIVREVSLVSVADRLPSPAISAFAKAVMEYDWQYR
ncbi:LysR substrate-binding domain-containing protein [Mesorhizobium caraganae]|uniref:LysR substrate-binding domain-containing protein n=1 Tax=Mesorhizobium caraganae TaxID=483206 RepID=A0ABV1Z0S1_9HYPH